jgi:hypothetical protein
MHDDGRAEPRPTRTVPCPAGQPTDDDSRMLLEHIVRQVQARTPVDGRERRSIERFVLEAGQLAEPLSEHADPVHVTASGIVTRPRGVPTAATLPNSCMSTFTTGHVATPTST